MYFLQRHYSEVVPKKTVNGEYEMFCFTKISNRLKVYGLTDETMAGIIGVFIFPKSLRIIKFSMFFRGNQGRGKLLLASHPKNAI